MIIREAEIKDARGIHDAHMASIQELCAADYNTEQLNGWGNRPFDEARRIDAIQNQHVWVVEVENQIRGYGQIKVFEEEGETVAHVHGLYLMKSVAGSGLGRKVVQRMVKCAYELDASRITLESTLTSHGFYLKMGFEDTGPQSSHEINGVQIESIPMVLELYTESPNQKVSEYFW